MAAMSTADKAKTARLLARKVFNGATATLNHDDIVAAVGAIDNAMEGVPTLLPNQLQSVALNLNSVLTEPFKTTATAAQKSALLGMWASVKYGLL